MKLEQKDFNWHSLITNRRFLVWTAASGLVLILTVFLGLIPQAQELVELRDELKTSERQLSTLRTKVSDLENIEARQAYQARASVNQIMPSRKPLLELLAGLNSVAVRNQVSFTDFSLSPGEISSASADFLESARTNADRRSRSRKSQEDYEAMPIELEVEGKFSDMQRFLIEVERSAPLVTITGLILNVKTDEMIRPSDIVQAELVLNSYYYTQPISSALEKPLPIVGTAENRVLEEIAHYHYPSAAVQERIMGGGYEDIFGLNRSELQLKEQAK